MEQAESAVCESAVLENVADVRFLSCWNLYRSCLLLLYCIYCHFFDTPAWRHTNSPQLLVGVDESVVCAARLLARFTTNMMLLVWFRGSGYFQPVLDCDI